MIELPIEESLRLRFGDAHFLVHFVFEGAAFARDEAAVAFGVDPGVDAFGFGALTFSIEIEILRVVGEPDIRPEHFELVECAAIVVPNAGIRRGFRESIPGIKTAAIGKNHGIRFAGIDEDGCPGGGTPGVAGSEVGGEDDFAEFHGIAVAKHAMDFGRREAHDLPIRAVEEIVFASIFDGLKVRRHDGDFCSGEFFQFGKRSGMVRVSVAVDDDPDVFRLETKFADGIDNQWRGSGHSGVQKNVSFRRGEKKRSQALGADKVEWADDFYRIGGLVPFQRLAGETEE